MPTRSRIVTRHWKTAILAFGFALFVLPVSFARTDEGKESTAVKPVPRDAGWKKRHEKFVEIAKKGGIELLFLGDSITDAWGGEGHGAKAAGTQVFTEEFLPLKAANFGIGGDRTQHVLWRLQNGELDGIEPKVVMLMIGTNNSNRNDNTAEEIAAGITAIVKEIQKRSAKTRILLLGIFPRANKKTEEENQAQMDKIRKVNEIIARLDDGGKTVKYLDIGDKFRDKDGKLPRKLMPDQLHFSAAGYRVWADAVKESIQSLLKK
jgi:lysophospholipase L1-like esterase